MKLDTGSRARLVGLFVSEAEETLALLEALAVRLRDRFEGDDLAEFGRAAHGLKGAAAALGYDELAAGLHELEALSLGLSQAGPERATRHDKLERALNLFSQGVGQMGASGVDAFPQQLADALRAVLGGPTEAAVAPTPAPAAPEVRPLEAAERLSVPAGEVDAALRLAVSLSRALGRLQGALKRNAEAKEIQGLCAGAEQLESAIAGLRLLPAEVAFSGLDEEVQQLALRLGKEVDLSVLGREVRADRRTLQSARTMIRHLVRNAVDHGLESPDDRVSRGKARRGRVSISVEAAESALRVSVEDDGAGFDVPEIRQELCRQRGDPERIAALSDPEVLQLLAKEGGSTRASASEISGRGLGLSAVSGLAAAAGGAMRVSTRRGLSATVSFTLPLEVYALEVLAVTAGGRTFGLPLPAVERTVFLRAAADAIHEGPAGATLAVDESIVPLHGLSDVLAMTRTGPDRFAVVVRTESVTTAFGVEDLGATANVVPTAVPGVADANALTIGLARLGGSEVIRILNPHRLLALARRARPRPSPSIAQIEGPRSEALLEVLLAEDSLATREVLRVLLEEQGFRVRVAADGEEALARVAEELPDVLVTDINMPRRDGLSLTRQLRAEARTNRLPVILLTSIDDPVTQASGAAAGADAYLLKSRFNAGVLRETLARIGVRKKR